MAATYVGMVVPISSILGLLILYTVQRETFTKGKVDEFDESEWIRQSLTNQYSQISAFIMLSNREMSSNLSKFISSKLLK